MINVNDNLYNALQDYNFIKKIERARKKSHTLLNQLNQPHETLYRRVDSTKNHEHNT